jgi:preprotein translocase subunit YajC
MLTFALAILQDAAPAAGSPAVPATPSSGILGSMLVPVLLCMAVFYFMIIGPERKQKKKREELLSNLQKGAKVMTTGGIYGTVTQVQDGIATVQVAEGVRMRFALTAIQSVIDEPAETAKPA